MAKQLWYHGLTRIPRCRYKPEGVEGLPVGVTPGVTRDPFSPSEISLPGLMIQTTTRAASIAAAAAINQKRGVGLNAQLFRPLCCPVARPM